MGVSQCCGKRDEKPITIGSECPKNEKNVAIPSVVEGKQEEVCNEVVDKEEKDVERNEKEKTEHMNDGEGEEEDGMIEFDEEELRAILLEHQNKNSNRYGEEQDNEEEMDSEGEQESAVISLGGRVAEAEYPQQQNM